MQQRYEVGGHWVTVEMSQGLVRIANDRGFKKAVSVQPRDRLVSLIDSIRVDYERAFGRPLAIRRDSLVVEIWGHLYAERLLLKYKRFFQVFLIFGLYKRFLRSCEVFDCGERHKDRNRWLWDRLAWYSDKIK